MASIELNMWEHIKETNGLKSLADMSPVIEDVEYKSGRVIFDGQYKGRYEANSSYLYTPGFLPEGIYEIKNKGMQVAIVQYDSPVLSETAWDKELIDRWTSSESIIFTVDPGKYCVVIVRRAGEPTISPVPANEPDILKLFNLVLFIKNLRSELNDVGDNVTQLEAKIDATKEIIDEVEYLIFSKPIPVEFEQGGIILDGTYKGRDGGTDYYYEEQIRSEALPSGSYEINPNGQKFVAIQYTSGTVFNETTYDKEISTRWTGENTVIDVEEGKFCRIVTMIDLGNSSLYPECNQLEVKLAHSIFDRVDVLEAAKREYDALITDLEDRVKVLEETVLVDDPEIPLNLVPGIILVDGNYKGRDSSSSAGYAARSGAVFPGGKYSIASAGQQYYIVVYNSDTRFDETTFIREIGPRWGTDDVVLTVAAGEFARIVTRIDGVTPFTPEDNKLKVSIYVPILARISKLEAKVDKALESPFFDGFYNNSGSTVKFISRMGMIDYGQGDEDTVQGIKKARKYGYDHIRLSLCFSSDNVPVLSHDPTIVLNGITYTIVNTPYETLKLGLLSLDEAMLLCKRLGMKVDIEFKFGITNSNIDIAMNIVSKYGMHRNTRWIDDKIVNLNYIKSVQPDALLGLIIHLSKAAVDTTLTLKNDVNDVQLVCVNPDTTPSATDDYSEEVLKYAADKGIDLKFCSVWTVNDLLKWVDKVAIIEVAYLKNPYKIMLDRYM